MLNAEVKDEFCRLITKIEVEYKPAARMSCARPASERSRGQSEVRPRLQNPPKSRGSAHFHVWHRPWNCSRQPAVVHAGGRDRHDDHSTIADKTRTTDSRRACHERARRDGWLQREHRSRRAGAVGAARHHGDATRRAGRGELRAQSTNAGASRCDQRHDGLAGRVHHERASSSPRLRSLRPRIERPSRCNG